MNRFTNTLGRVRVAAPCGEDWDEMRGDERVRFCSRCSLNVYNLSAMTRREAERLVVSNEGRLCVRFYQRKDGTILTQNCPSGLIKLKRRVSRVAGATAAAAISFLAGVGIAPTSKQSEHAGPSVAAAPLPSGVAAAPEAGVNAQFGARGGEEIAVVEDYAVVAGGPTLAPATSFGILIPFGFISAVFTLLTWPLLGLREGATQRRLNELRIWSNDWSRPESAAALPREGGGVELGR